MEFITVKPLSVNECWQGSRYKTTKYKQYETEMLFLLPRIVLPAPPYAIALTFGVSSPLADFDNPVKPFVDILQKKYGFNDKLIVQATINKLLVPKGREYIGFKITQHFPR